MLTGVDGVADDERRRLRNVYHPQTISSMWYINMTQRRMVGAAERRPRRRRSVAFSRKIKMETKLGEGRDFFF